jgi:hypothetical protein
MIEKHLHSLRVPGTAGGVHRGEPVDLEKQHKALGIALVGTVAPRWVTRLYTQRIATRATNVSMVDCCPMLQKKLRCLRLPRSAGSVQRGAPVGLETESEANKDTWTHSWDTTTRAKQACVPSHQFG